MKIKKISLIMRLQCILVACLLLITTLSVNAHEFSPKRYPSDLRFSNAMKHMVAYISYNVSNIKDSNIRDRLSNAVTDWEYMDDGYVSLPLVSTPDKAYIECSDQWSPLFPEDASGITVSSNLESTIFNWAFSGSSLYGPPETINNVYKTIKCKIYVNYSMIRDWAWHDIQKVWSHEFGHALGLNETNDGTRTIMRQGKGSIYLGWEDYWKPQNHDRADLRRFNYKSWSAGTFPTT